MPDYEAIQDFKYAANIRENKSVKKGERLTLDTKQGERFEKAAFIKSVGREDPVGDDPLKKSDPEKGKEGSDEDTPGDPPVDPEIDAGWKGEKTPAETEGNGEKGPEETGEETPAASGAVTEKVNWMDFDKNDLIKYALSKHNLEISGDMSLEDIQMMVLEKES